ncbi:MAG: FdhF/YdeP family oxidoreductase [Acidimicrobiia bacterium]
MPTPAPDHDAGDDRLRIRGPQRVAAGLPAAIHAGRHITAQTGLRRGARILLALNQPDGFDCPGCAWPEPDDPSRFEFCENGAKAVAEEATLRRVDAAFFAAHPLTDLAARSDHWLGQQGRLTEPVYKAPGDDRYRPVTWDDALDLVAGRIESLADPDRAVFYTSGRTSNEAAFLYQLLVRATGTNNLPDCSNMCHESSGFALKETIGAGKGSVTLDDIHHAELLVVVGQNPGTNHPRMLSALEQAKRNGARIVAVNPLPEAGLLRFRNPQRLGGLVGRGTALADLFLQIRVGGDMALFQLVNRALLERRAIDKDFVEDHCDGFDAMAAHLADADPDAVLASTGLTAAEVDKLADLVAGSERIIVCWAMGLTQHRAAVPTIREVVNTLLLRGAIGKPGAGVCPVRGHSNVQGDRTMGIYEKPDEAFLGALGAEFGFSPPTHHGYDTVDAIRAMARGDVDLFVAMGGNFVAAAPDTDATAAALSRCRLSVQVSTKLNRSHVLTGDAALILPCLGRTEIDRSPSGQKQFVTVEDSMSVVHASRGSLEPASPALRSEVGIIAGLARRIPRAAAVADWDSLAGDYDEIRRRIERVVPGFERFNERARQPGGFTLPHPPRDSRSFPTATGKARLSVNHFEPLRIPDGRLLLQTVRSHDQYNTTIYGLDDRYRGISGGRRVLFCHEADLARLGFADGDVVDIVSEWTDGTERRAPAFRLVAYPVAERTCAAYFPEANVLVPLDSVAEGSQTPTSKSVIVRLEA